MTRDYDRTAILVVDDRDEDLLVLQSVLADEDREIVTARSGPDALRLLLYREFAAIVLDVVMPDMDGFALAGMIRKRERSSRTPLLFLTGVELELGAIYRAYALGAVDCLTKPVDPDVLRAKVDVFVSLFEKDRHIRAQAGALLESERRNRELELDRVRIANDRRYRNLADAVPQIVWTTDARGRVTYVNRRWAELTGTGKALPESWLDAVHPDERAECRERWTAAIESGEPLTMECRLRDASGEYRWHLCHALPERTGDTAEITGWLGTHTDVHDVHSAKERAEGAIRVRDEFLSIASHELRTPLSALLVQLGGLDMTLRSGRTDVTKASRKVGAALRQTDRMVGLVDHLLDVSRMALGRIELSREECDLAELAREVAERFHDAARAVGCELVLDAPRPALGRWDRTRIERVLTNLISNGLKYGRDAPVELSVECDSGEARVSVRDRGIGIDAADQARIFERFERAAPVSNYGGLGLGLYIARTIVEAHGGSIRVVSRPGEGATFVVTLPRQPITREKLETASEEAR